MSNYSFLENFYDSAQDTATGKTPKQQAADAGAAAAKSARTAGQTLDQQVTAAIAAAKAVSLAAGQTEAQQKIASDAAADSARTEAQNAEAASLVEAHKKAVSDAAFTIKQAAINSGLQAAQEAALKGKSLEEQKTVASTIAMKLSAAAGQTAAQQKEASDAAIQQVVEYQKKKDNEKQHSLILESSNTNHNDEDINVNKSLSVGAIISSVLFFIILAVWMIAGFSAFIMSLVCFGYNSNPGYAFTGFLLSLFAGPFYWIYYGYNKNYCVK